MELNVKNLNKNVKKQFLMLDKHTIINLIVLNLIK